MGRSSRAVADSGMTGGTWRSPRAVFSIGRMYEMNNFTTCQCGGLAAVIQSRIERGHVRAFCRMFHVKHSCGPPRPHVPPKQVFDRAVLSECLSESEHVREDKETVFNSAVRVPCNARLKCRRRPARLRRYVRHCLRMFQPHGQGPREVGFMFRLVQSAICISARRE